MRLLPHFACPAISLLLLLSPPVQATLLETEEDLRAWMEEVRKGTSVQALPLQEPKQFEPFRYRPQAKPDPFDASKISISVNPLRLPGGPDPDRRKEPLEAFPLETIRMVGTLVRDGRHYALLQAGKMVYQARAGNYIGQNLGKIVRVTDKAIDIIETLPDENRGWTNRKIRLELQESKK